MTGCLGLGQDFGLCLCDRALRHIVPLAVVANHQALLKSMNVAQYTQISESDIYSIAHPAYYNAVSVCFVFWGFFSRFQES